MSRIVRIAAAGALTLSALWLGTAPAGAASLPTCTARLSLTTMPTTASGSVDCRLAYGHTGDGVKALQESLYFCNGENVARDGIFGNATKAAVLRVQQRGGISQDGVYGPQTRDRMSFMTYGSSTPRCTV
ncbi:peptidoglycan-binding domain-containing protein [Kitasatospora sp. NPDC051914]|uniref:peptidoglycan-binding domain-containing protein n=1 Tax=Kitasatospora sp. NPDC051914 TaxID=3154945 RepID=UPI00341B57F2